MGVLRRLAQIIRSQVNSWVQDAEDPEKILDQAIEDMQTDLIQIRQAVAQAIATQKRTERQREQTQTLAKERYNRAQLALKQGHEDQARAALAQRQAYLKMVNQLDQHLTEQERAVARLKANLRDLEVKIADARTRRDLYIARARSAAASQRIQETITQVDDSKSWGVLGRMEEKVLNLEAQADALAELNQARVDHSLEGRFAALAQDDAAAIEAELSQLKAQLPPS